MWVVLFWYFFTRHIFDPIDHSFGVYMSILRLVDEVIHAGHRWASLGTLISFRKEDIGGPGMRLPADRG